MNIIRSQSVFIKSLIFLAFLFLCLLISNNSQAQIINSAAIGAIVKEQFSTGKLEINKIVLEEPHIIPKVSLNKFLAKYQGKKINVNDLKEIQKRLSKYYYAKGYINSGVIVPNQRIVNGVLRLRAIHGRLTRVKVKGNKRISNQYIKHAVAKGVTVPLSTEKLQLALEALQKHALIAEVKAQVSPGEKLGQSILELSIKENKPYFLNTQLSNHQSPSIGQFRLGVNGGHRDIMKRRDTLALDLGISQGLVDTQIDYSLPLSNDDYMFNAHINYARFSIIDDEFSAADINSRSTTVGASLSAPVLKKADLDVSAGIGFDIKHMTLEMFGQPAPTEGFTDGENNSTPLVLHANAIYQKPKFVAAMYAGIRRGTSINLFGDSTEQQIFTVAVGQLSIGFKPRPKLEVHLRFNGQLTSDDLLPVEKFAVGGVKTVRGYRENLLVRDNGLVASSQLRYSLLPSKLFLVPFIDAGRSWNSDQGKLGGSGEQIVSTGAGLQWKATKQIYSEVFWGKTLSDVSSRGDLTQDYSMHFLIRYTVL